MECPRFVTIAGRFRKAGLGWVGIIHVATGFPCFLSRYYYTSLWDTAKCLNAASSATIFLSLIHKKWRIQSFPFLKF